MHGPGEQMSRAMFVFVRAEITEKGVHGRQKGPETVETDPSPDTLYRGLPMLRARAAPGAGQAHDEGLGGAP